MSQLPEAFFSARDAAIKAVWTQKLHQTLPFIFNGQKYYCVKEDINGEVVWGTHYWTSSGQ